MPIQLPIGEENAPSAAWSIWSPRKAYVFQTDESGKFTEEPVPADMASAVEHAREALIEMVAEADEKLMERFFEAGTLTDDGAGRRAPERRPLAAKLFPLVCTSAAAQHRHPAAARRHRRVPAVAGRTAVHGGGHDRYDDAAVRRREGAGGAFVWKTIADPFAGRITHVSRRLGHR